jgi:hypothetical protein
VTTLGHYLQSPCRTFVASLGDVITAGVPMTTPRVEMRYAVPESTAGGMVVAGPSAAKTPSIVPSAVRKAIERQWEALGAGQ